MTDFDSLKAVIQDTIDTLAFEMPTTCRQSPAGEWIKWSAKWTEANKAVEELFALAKTAEEKKAAAAVHTSLCKLCNRY